MREREDFLTPSSLAWTVGGSGTIPELCSTGEERVNEVGNAGLDGLTLRHPG